MRPRDDEPIQFDAYLDGLADRARMASPGRGPGVPGPASASPPRRAQPAPAQPARDLDRVVLLVRASLPRFHPSFTFEERLSGLLRAMALDHGMGAGPATRAAVPGVLVPFRPAARTTATDQVRRDRRRAVVGGVLASGLSICLSVAGAALLAWRRGRVGHLERPA